MCGICGFNFNDDALLSRMMLAIEHRGPDQSGKYTDDNLTLGHRRLSIVDLSTNGRQPMKNEDGDVWIIFNGEIYNYLDLKAVLKKKHQFKSSSDTEVIVHLYEEVGEQVFSMLSGDFAIALYDSKKKMLYLARDHLGVKPLYYYFDGERFLFCSEIKGILEAEFVKRTINPAALDAYLTLRYNPLNETMFCGIMKVKPGHLIKFDIREKKLMDEAFWALSIENNLQKRRTSSEIKDEYRDLLSKAVSRRLMGDVPIGAYLSGGIDSSSIVAAMRLSNSDFKINTFSVGFGYSEEEDELRFAKLVSEKFSTDHQEIIVKPNIENDLKKIVWLCDEPLADPACIPIYLLSREAKKKSTVVLTGDGGDELFAGYEQYKFMTALHKTRALLPITKLAAPLAIRVAPNFVLDKFFKYASSLGDKGRQRAIKMITAKGDVERLHEMVGIFDEEEKREILAAPEEIVGKMNRAAMQEEYFSRKTMPNEAYLNRVLKMDIKTALPENFLLKTDRMCMAWAIEGRVPLLDKDLADFSFSIPPSWKLRVNQEKYIMKQAFRKELPRKVSSRKKQRFFVPIDKWLDKDLKEFARSQLDAKRLSSQGILRPAAINAMMSNYGKGKLFYARQLWTLLNFQMWQDEFGAEMPAKVKLKRVY